MERKIGGKKVRLVKGDITELAVDAIVNAANAQLVLGGGVAGAIRKKGGPSIQEECNQIGGTTVGNAVVTGAGNLKAKYVIHAVGPRFGEGDEDNKLKSATFNSLKRATEKECKSVAFPAISTGIFGFPKDRCARIMLTTIKEFFEREQTSLNEVILCLYAEEDLKIFEEAMEEIFK